MDLQTKTLVVDHDLEQLRGDSVESFKLMLPKLWKGSRDTFRDPFADKRIKKRKMKIGRAEKEKEKDDESLTFNPSARYDRNITFFMLYLHNVL